VTEAEILRELIELAGRAGLAVQAVPRGRAIEGGPPVTSAVVRVRGEVRVVLVPSDAVDERIAVVARALREHAAAYLEAHHVPPALRERIETA
jgi:hypothetical protein